MIEKLREKNIIAAIIYLILAISVLPSLIKSFSIVGLVSMIADILLILALFKNSKGKKIVISLFLSAALSADSLITMTILLITSNLGGAIWISQLVSFAGSFLYFIFAVIAITDFLPSYKEAINKYKYLPLLICVIGGLICGFRRTAGVDGGNIFFILINYIAMWLVLCWMISPEDHRMEDSLTELSESMTKTFSSAKQSLKEKSESVASNVAEKASSKTSVVEKSSETTSDSTLEKSEDAYEELKKFKKLLDDGIITQEDFDAKKKQLLGL